VYCLPIFIEAAPITDRITVVATILVVITMHGMGIDGVVINSEVVIGAAIVCDPIRLITTESHWAYE
jgi:hypothetical protein